MSAMVICEVPCERGQSLPLKENEDVGGGTRRSGILLSLSISSSVMPSAKGSWFIWSVRSRNGSTVMDFCGGAEKEAGAEGLLFAGFSSKKERNTNARPTPPPAAPAPPPPNTPPPLFSPYSPPPLR